VIHNNFQESVSPLRISEDTFFDFELFDPTSILLPYVLLLLEILSNGGLGIYLTRQVMDEECYKMSPYRRINLAMIMDVEK
jgi:hypothetical protein